MERGTRNLGPTTANPQGSSLLSGSGASGAMSTALLPVASKDENTVDDEVGCLNGRVGYDIN